MAQDSTSFISAMKQVWVTDRIEEQIYTKNPLLEAFERVTPQKEVGNKALIAVEGVLAGGYSAVPRSGSTSLNAAGNRQVKQAEYNYTHHWFQVELETAVIDETSGQPLAVAEAVEYEMTGAIKGIQRQLTRQGFMNGDALIAKTTTTSSSTTVKLDSTGYGNQAIVRGWLYPGLIIDIGTTGSEASVCNDREITEVIQSATEPKIKISGAAVETSTSEYVSIANARSGSTSNEMNGLLNMISESTTLGGIEPSAFPTWKASIDSTTTSISLEALIERQDAIFQKTGEEADWALAGVKQYRNYYLELQNQVRFNGDGGLQGGAMDKLMLGVTKVDKQPDCPDGHFWLLTKGDLVAIRKNGPQWADELYGGLNKPVQYKPGTTKVVGALVYRMQTGLKRRNSHAGLTALT